MSTYWGSRNVSAVASNGVATQLYPTTGGCNTRTNFADTSTYPPATSGEVRRPIHGRVGRIEVTGDGTNGGLVELWDVAGLDRGASNNVNNDGATASNTLTDAYLTANGTKIGVVNITANTVVPFTATFDDIPFNKGLAIRYVDGGGGYVIVSPYVEGGFMRSVVHS